MSLICLVFKEQVLKGKAMVFYAVPMQFHMGTSDNSFNPFHCTNWERTSLGWITIPGPAHSQPSPRFGWEHEHRAPPAVNTEPWVGCAPSPSPRARDWFAPICSWDCFDSLRDSCLLGSSPARSSGLLQLQTRSVIPSSSLEFIPSLGLLLARYLWPVH